MYTGPNYQAGKSVYCSTHRSLGFLLLCASEAHKGRMEWKRMCALHKLWLIGLRESGGDEKGRGREGGRRRVVMEQIGQKIRCVTFSKLANRNMGGSFTVLQQYRISLP